MKSMPAAATLRFERDSCANCFVKLPADSMHRPHLFCTPVCKDFASLVRYWRRVSRDGRMNADPLVVYAVRIQIAHLLAGGYNRTARTIAPSTRVLVLERDKVCVACGARGEEIDHIDGESGAPVNLQLLCKGCHHAKTETRIGPASADQSAVIERLFVERVLPDRPIQASDDAEGWRAVERTLRAERTARLSGQSAARKSRRIAPQEFVMLDTIGN